MKKLKDLIELGFAGDILVIMKTGKRVKAVSIEEPRTFVANSFSKLRKEIKEEAPSTANSYVTSYGSPLKAEINISYGRVERERNIMRDCKEVYSVQYYKIIR